MANLRQLGDGIEFCSTGSSIPKGHPNHSGGNQKSFLLDSRGRGDVSSERIRSRNLLGYLRDRYLEPRARNLTEHLSVIPGKTA